MQLKGSNVTECRLQVGLGRSENMILREIGAKSRGEEVGKKYIIRDRKQEGAGERGWEGTRGEKGGAI